MSGGVFRKLNVSFGEVAVVAVHFIIGLFGAGLAFFVVGKVNGGELVSQQNNLWIAASGAIGALAALRLSVYWLGGHGLRGIFRALIGIIAINVFGAMIAGTMISSIEGTFAAPVMLYNALVSAPILWSIWGAVLAGAHTAYLIRDNERESIFAGDRYGAAAPTALSSITRSNVYRG